MEDGPNSSALGRAFRAIRRDGITATLARAGEVALRMLREYRIFRRPDAENVFTRIYELNYWGSTESVSGTGSTVAFTERLRADLVGLIDEHRIGTIFDAPCGDFNWMRLVVASRPIDYVGVDIVAPMIADLQARHGSDRVRFVHADLTQFDYPRADLMICRDCLFHLSYADARKILANFVASGTPLLLATTHRPDGSFTNHDIRTGAFRPIDLFAPPYSLPTEVAHRVEDDDSGLKRREMCLWTSDQVAAALARFP